LITLISFFFNLVNFIELKQKDQNITYDQKKTPTLTSERRHVVV